MAILFLSCEQEAVLHDNLSDRIPTPRLDHYYVVVHPYPWGNEPENWKDLITCIGPIHENENTDAAIEATANMLRCLGNTALTLGDARGTWHNGGLYTPHPDEIEGNHSQDRDKFPVHPFWDGCE